MAFDCCNFFKAVSDPTRLKIMLILSGREMCVSDICSHFEMTQPTISHHLGILRSAGILKSRKEGKEVYYTLNRCNVDSCCRDFMNRFDTGECE